MGVEAQGPEFTGRRSHDHSSAHEEISAKTPTADVDHCAVLHDHVAFKITLRSPQDSSAVD